MGYISTEVWRDLTDGHTYREGEIFPFDGREVSAERLDELLSGRNRAGLALIRAIDVRDEQTEVRKEDAPGKASDGRKTASRKPRAKK